MVNSSSEILPYEISWCNDDANYLLQFLNHHQTAQFFREMLQVINHIHITIHFLTKSEAKKLYRIFSSYSRLGFSTIAIIVYNKLFESQKFSDLISFEYKGTVTKKNDLILQFLFYNFYNKAYMYITYVYYKMHLVGWRRE